VPKADQALLLIVAFALAVRVAYVLLAAPEGVHGPDSGLYDRLAVRLLSEGHYIAEDHLGGISQASRPVLFPFVLAGIYAIFGHSIIAAQIFQSVLGALTCGLTYSLGCEAFDRRSGIVAGIGAAIFPQLIYYTGTITTETLHIFLLTASVWLLFAAAKREAGVLWWLAGGAALGLAILARSAALGLLPLLAVWLLIRTLNWKTAAIRFACVFAGAAIVMSPWVIRNYRELDAFVPATTEGGYTFWVTNNPRAIGGGECFPPDDLTPFENLNEVEADRLFYRMGLEHVKAEPWLFVHRVASRFVRLWRPWPHASEVGVEEAVIGGVSFVPVLLLFVAGVAMARRRWRELSLFYTLIIYTTAMCSVYMAVTRYRAPLMPVVLCVAGYAAARLYGAIAGRAQYTAYKENHE